MGYDLREPHARGSRVNNVMEVPRSVIESTELSSNAKVVYGVLVGLCKEGGGSTIAMVPEVAASVNLSNQAIARAYVELIRAKLITRHRDKDFVWAPWRTTLVTKGRNGK
jgi:hypothetical protein